MYRSVVKHLQPLSVTRVSNLSSSQNQSYTARVRYRNCLTASLVRATAATTTAKAIFISRVKKMNMPQRNKVESAKGTQLVASFAPKLVCRHVYMCIHAHRNTSPTNTGDNIDKLLLKLSDTDFCAAFRDSRKIVDITNSIPCVTLM